MYSQDQIKAVAESLLPGFLPKDPDESSLTFHFTIPRSGSYKVRFEKGGKGHWEFQGYESDDPANTVP